MRGKSRAGNSMKRRADLPGSLV